MTYFFSLNLSWFFRDSELIKEGYLFTRVGNLNLSYESFSKTGLLMLKLGCMSLSYKDEFEAGTLDLEGFLDRARGLRAARRSRLRGGFRV